MKEVEIAGIKIQIGTLMAIDCRNFDLKPCPICEEIQHGGSHYHCGNCLERSGMYGHWHSKDQIFTCEKKR